MNGIGSHTLPNNGAFDTWLTPPAILSELGTFDLDPCAAPSPRAWATAKSHIELPEDGLAIPWAGRVWLNPPYGRDIGAWLEKMAKHGNGIALTFARTETDAWGWVWPYAAGVLFIAGRLHFCLPDGTRAKGNAGGPSALIAYSESDFQILKDSSIRGALVRRILR
jgi:hypothetical protein